MPAFRYRAQLPTGLGTRGILEAPSARQARQVLRDRGLVVLSIGAVGNSSMAAFFARQAITATRRALVTRQLATLLRASMPLAEALQAVAAQCEHRAAQRVLQGVAERVSEGSALADALARYPGSFPSVYCSTVAAAERSGHLPEVFERLADHGESQQALRQKVQLAMVYPAILLVVSILVVGFLLGFVVPDVVQAFSREHAALPLATRVLISLSDATRAHGLAACLTAGLTLAGASWSLRRPALRRRWHALTLRLPVWGGFVRSSEAARFVGTLAILCRSGVALVEAMHIAAAVVSNELLRKHLQAAARQLGEGSSLAICLERSATLPALMLHMIASGERAGELDGMLERAAALQERHLAGRIALLVSLCEPLMLLVMGGLVLFIVLAILLPILNLNQMVN